MSNKTSNLETLQYAQDYTVAELAALCRTKDREIARLQSLVDNAVMAAARRAVETTHDCEQECALAQADEPPHNIAAGVVCIDCFNRHRNGVKTSCNHQRDGGTLQWQGTTGGITDAYLCTVCKDIVYLKGHTPP